MLIGRSWWSANSTSERWLADIGARRRRCTRATCINSMRISESSRFEIKSQWKGCCSTPNLASRWILSMTCMVIRFGCVLSISPHHQNGFGRMSCGVVWMKRPPMKLSGISRGTIPIVFRRPPRHWPLALNRYRGLVVAFLLCDWSKLIVLSWLGRLRRKSR